MLLSPNKGTPAPQSAFGILRRSAKLGFYVGTDLQFVEFPKARIDIDALFMDVMNEIVISLAARPLEVDPLFVAVFNEVVGESRRRRRC
jgi:hypothetical protein